MGYVKHLRKVKIKVNIFKFHLHVEVKSSVNSIPQAIAATYASKQRGIDNYKDFVNKKWNDLGKDNIITLFPETAILVYSEIARCKYFFIDTDPSHDLDQMTTEVFIISQLEDISDAYNIVYKDIKKKLRGKFKFKLTEKKAFLYVYDGNDIIASRVVVKADIITFTRFRPVEIVRDVILIILATIFVIIAAIPKNNSTLCNVMYSLAASSIFFIITDVLVKICCSQKIEIKDLTNWIQTEDTVKKNNEQRINLNNPKFEEE